MKCRHCGEELKYEFIDLYNSPPSNSYLTKCQLNEPEISYPLKLYICNYCYLVQIDEYVKSDVLFNSEYSYFSSYSSHWLKHAKLFSDYITKYLNLDKNSFVIEIASNDGYLLQYFKEKEIPCLGIEPTSSTAKAAREKGIDVLEQFFNTSTASNIKKADLLIGNNVLAHVPDINNFVAGLKIALNPNGTISLEFPHILNLINFNQFDTIYHEHFFYFSLITVHKIFSLHGLKIYNVEELTTHGGSLRIFATHNENLNIQINKNVDDLIQKERNVGLDTIDGYHGFEKKVQSIKWNFWNYLINFKNKNNKIAAYGAAAKGNTFLNYCGIKSDIINFVVDDTPYKQGKFLPMSHIPIVSEETLRIEKPDLIIILPWNWCNEIVQKLEFTKKWGAQLLTAIPELKIF